MKAISRPFNIIITGMPASGKSTVSKLLADSLSMNLIELDAEIEKSAQMKITEIFEKYGEEYFRSVEKKLLKKFLENENIVLSTGGGIIKDAENVEIMKQKGIVVFLNADVETLYGRINDESRPLLVCKNPKERLEKLYNERINLYKKADIEINSALASEKIVEEIKRKLKR